jgi:hypothetical protein
MSPSTLSIAKKLGNALRHVQNLLWTHPPALLSSKFRGVLSAQLPETTSVNRETGIPWSFRAG